jgi:hypothetical protein
MIMGKGEKFPSKNVVWSLGDTPTHCHHLISCQFVSYFRLQHNANVWLITNLEMTHELFLNEYETASCSEEEAVWLSCVVVDEAFSWKGNHPLGRSIGGPTELEEWDSHPRSENSFFSESFRKDRKWHLSKKSSYFSLFLIYFGVRASMCIYYINIRIYTCVCERVFFSWCFLSQSTAFFLTFS